MPKGFIVTFKFKPGQVVKTHFGQGLIEDATINIGGELKYYVASGWDKGRWIPESGILEVING